MAALPSRKAVVRAFGDRGLRLEARALAMLTSHVDEAAERAVKGAAAAATTMNVDGIAEGEEGFESSSAAAAAADAALAKLLDAYEPGECS
jgi:hypothetical protein